jgi:phage-related tail fiber protein
MSYFSIITDIGLAKIAAAASGTPLNITEMAVGDGNGSAVTPTASSTGLVNERYRTDVNRVYADEQNPNRIICELIIPSDQGGWTIREVGVFDDSGDMIVFANFPDTYKPTAVEGSTRESVIRIIFEHAQASSVTLTVDGSTVTVTQDIFDDHVNDTSVHWQQAVIDAVNTAVNNHISAPLFHLPTGFIFPFYGNNAPSGSLALQRSFSRISAWALFR